MGFFQCLLRNSGKSYSIFGRLFVSQLTVEGPKLSIIFFAGKVAAVGPSDVKPRFHGSLFVPLEKWAMLMAGNYRGITADSMRTAQEVVLGV